jgi:hemin uptake protein HemP
MRRSFRVRRRKNMTEPFELQATPPADPGETPSAPAENANRVFDSTDIFRGNREVIIQHNGREYRLRHTHLGKLILTA